MDIEILEKKRVRGKKEDSYWKHRNPLKSMTLGVNCKNIKINTVSALKDSSRYGIIEKIESTDSKSSQGGKQ